jgi:large subunit ribosomal protein L10
MRPEKSAIAASIKERLQESSFVILAEYRGMTVSQSEELRGQLSAADARMMVVPNRQFGHVARDSDLGGLTDGVSGPTAMVFGSGDVVEASKILKVFAKANKLPVVKLGALDGRVITAGDVNELADLPPREVLYAMVVGTVAAPMSQLVGVMNQKLSSLLYVLTAAKEKKASE